MFNIGKIFVVILFSIGLISCTSNNTAPSFRKLSREDPDNLSYQGVYKIGKEYKINKKTYKPCNPKSFTQVGIASWYGSKGGFHGKKTANGDKFNKNLLTAAHKTLPLPSLVKVTNTMNKKSIILMVNDRGPFKKNRILDVSERAAEILGFKKCGVVKVVVEYLPKETEKFLSKMNLTPKTTRLAKVKNRGKITSKRLAYSPSKCSVNCHIKLVNIKHKLAIN